MIEVSLYTLADGDMVGFRLRGHSGYAESGSDIVCSAVSSAGLMTANTVTEIMKISAETQADEGNIMLRIFSEDAALCRDVLQGFRLHMLLLEEQYPDYIIVKTTEV